MKTSFDISYVDNGNQQQKLDVYAPAKEGRHPVVLWIHGGGWKQGDKRGVQLKPQSSVDHGCVFVSTNYRFVPEVTIEEMAGDVAAAVAWVRKNIHQHHGDPDKIVIAGHSAGAHLAALLCTDTRYLEKAGVPMSCIKGCIPVDTAVYDIPTRIAESGVGENVYANVFGTDPAFLKSRSPITYVKSGAKLPSFLILHVASRKESTEQSQAFAKALNAAGIEATTVPGKNKTHGTISTDLGKPDDPPTKEVSKFLERVFD